MVFYFAYDWLAFAKGYIGLDAVDEILGSARLRGLVRMSLANKRILVQRSPLTVEMLASLERYVVEAEDPRDRLSVRMLAPVTATCRESKLD